MSIHLLQDLNHLTWNSWGALEEHYNNQLDPKRISIVHFYHCGPVPTQTQDMGLRFIVALDWLESYFYKEFVLIYAAVY